MSSSKRAAIYPWIFLKYHFLEIIIEIQKIRTVKKKIIIITDDSYGASQHQGELQKIKVNTKLWLSYHIDK